MSIIKKMDIKEFRESGYLQEVNRQFFHPLGIALEITINEDTLDEKITGIWDYRNDPEGMYFDIKNSKKSRIKQFCERATNIQKEMIKFEKSRKEKFGWVIEPIPED